MTASWLNEDARQSAAQDLTEDILASMSKHEIADVMCDTRTKLHVNFRYIDVAIYPFFE